MTPNPYLQKLGYTDNDRVVILHADDIGMCHAGLVAYRELLEFGVLSSAAAMVPCAWFAETAATCRTLQSHQPHLDMGVHLTLTSEWDGFRWGPISTRDAASGLLDEEGYFYHGTRAVQEYGRPETVALEVEAQIQRALAAGIDVTHIDSHMGSIFHPKFLPLYIELARKYRIPALSLRLTENNFLAAGFDEETAERFAHWSQELEASGFPLLDSIFGMPLDSHENRLDVARQWLDGLEAGIHYFLFHPCIDTPELRAFAPDWRSRVADYELFINEAWRQALAASGVKVIGWKPIRGVMRLGY
jgi:hypothetical protein